MLRSVFKQSWVGVVALSLAGFAVGADQSAEKQESEKTDEYPLQVCVVSGEKLGEMGEPAIIQYEGREVRLCCSSCEKSFNEDPAGYIKKIDEAAAAKGDATTQPSTQPTDEHADHDHGHDEGHDDHAAHEDHAH